MSATHEMHRHPAADRTIGSALGLFWFFVATGLGLTASLVVLGGSRIIASGGVRAVVLAMLVLFALHAANAFRHRHDPIGDRDLIRARERRGF